MLRLMRAAVIVCAVGTLLGAADPSGRAVLSQPGASAPDPNVIVCLDPGSVSRRDVISRGMVTAEEIFKRVGVHLKWSCDPRRIGQGMSNGHAVLMRLEDDAPADVSQSSLAYSRPFALDGVRIGVLWRRFEPLVAVHPNTAGMILGHMMAHEIAHVLSRSDYHGDQGLMNARWTDEDLLTMQTGLLQFSPEEGQIIRDGLRSIEETTAKANSKPVAVPAAPGLLLGSPAMLSLR